MHGAGPPASAIEQACKDFLNYLRDVRQLSAHTLDNYQRDLRGLQRFCQVDAAVVEGSAHDHSLHPQGGQGQQGEQVLQGADATGGDHGHGAGLGHGPQRRGGVGGLFDAVILVQVHAETAVARAARLARRNASPALDDAGHRLQDRQDLVLRCLQDDHFCLFSYRFFNST